MDGSLTSIRQDRGALRPFPDRTNSPEGRTARKSSQTRPADRRSHGAPPWPRAPAAPPRSRISIGSKMFSIGRFSRASGSACWNINADVRRRGSLKRIRLGRSKTPPRRRRVAKARPMILSRRRLSRSLNEHDDRDELFPCLSKDWTVGQRHSAGCGRRSWTKPFDLIKTGRASDAPGTVADTWDLPMTYLRRSPPRHSLVGIGPPKGLKRLSDNAQTRPFGDRGWCHFYMHLACGWKPKPSVDETASVGVIRSHLNRRRL